MKHKLSSRILLVGPLPPPTAGVEALTDALLGHLKGGPWSVRHVDTQRRRTSVASRGRWTVMNFVGAAGDLLAVAWQLARFRPCVLHTPMSSTATGVVRDSSVAALGFLFGAKVVLHVHGGDFDYLSRTGPVPIVALCRWALRRATRVVVLSNYWRDLVRDLVGAGVRPVVVPNGSEDLSGEPRRAAKADAPVTLLHVGAQGRRKGVHELVEAVADLRSEGLNVHLVLLGGEEWSGEWDRITNRISAFELDAMVTRTGHLEGDARRGWFARADIFVLPSHHEGAPVALLEAFSAGLPAVATSVGAIPEMLADGRGGTLVAAGDSRALAAALGHWICDPAARQSAGAFNRDRWERHHRMSIHLDRLEGTLRTAAGRPDYPQIF